MAMSIAKVDVDVADSLMLREESTTKEQQSFTIRLRRDKLAGFFSRFRRRLRRGLAWSGQVWQGILGAGWTRCGQDSGGTRARVAPGCTQHQQASHLSGSGWPCEPW